jgi:hypothetical protein
MNLPHRIKSRLNRETNLLWNHRRVKLITREIQSSVTNDEKKPVIFFNASTRLSGLSQNAGFSLVSSLALRYSGIPVVHFVCQRGLSHCVLGTNKAHPQDPPPCAECMRTSRLVFSGAEVQSFTFQQDAGLGTAIGKLPLADLLEFTYENIPLGKLVLPSLRWILRKHHLQDDADTRYLAGEYILSAWHVAREFDNLIHKANPQAVVVFNGMFYPEAAARWVAHKHKLPVYSHEVGMLPLSAFFTSGEATTYPVKVDDGFQLNETQNKQLDEYMQQRTQGRFVTAGVKFWPEMHALDQAFWERAKEFKGIVPVFTNVVFDTSQGHANSLFEHMFAWLDAVLDEIKRHPEILFIIRAHPDEERPGKESRETVSDWVRERGAGELANVLYIPPNQYVSSYELIRHAKFVMVYNSTVGLEASVMDKPVLCAGKARYTLVPTVYFPQDTNLYNKMLREFLAAGKISHPSDFRLNARRVLYSQLFRASLPFDQFLEEDGVWRGYVRLKKFNTADLLPERSATMEVVENGILKGLPFIMDL